VTIVYDLTTIAPADSGKWCRSEGGRLLTAALPLRQVHDACADFCGLPAMRFHRRALFLQTGVLLQPRLQSLLHDI
jgi:hypothetical protein